MSIQLEKPNVSRQAKIWTGVGPDARYSSGAVGVISVTSNVVPALMHQLMHNGESWQIARHVRGCHLHQHMRVQSVLDDAASYIQRALQDGPNPELRDKLVPLMGWLFAEPNPIGVEPGGYCSPRLTMPSDSRDEGSKCVRGRGDQCPPGPRSG